MAGDLSGRGGLAYLMNLLRGGMFAPQGGGGGTKWGGPGGGGWLGQAWTPSSLQAGGGPPAAPAAPAGAGGPEDAQTELLRALVAKQPTVEEAYAAKAKARDPVQFAQQQYAARLAGDPWAQGGQFEGRRAADLYTPEQIVASGGMTAENQLRSQQKKTDNFDPEELRRLNEQYRRNYV